MKAFSSTFTPLTKSTRLAYHPKGSSTAKRRRGAGQPSEGIVAPGRVLSKAEREERRSEEERWKSMSLSERERELARTDTSPGHLMRADSFFNSLDGQQDERVVGMKQRQYDYSFEALWQKLLALPQASPWLNDLGNEIDDHFAPRACTTALAQFRGDERGYGIRSLLVVFMLVFIVFGALYSLAEYLLFVTRASACDVSTVFLPVTYTVTKTLPGPLSSARALPDHANTTLTTTAQSTSTLTHTVTSFATAAQHMSSISTLPYVYTIDSAGNTDWINGVSPNPGVSLVTATTTITVDPSQTTSTENMQVDPTEVTYLTGPTYTSTVYAFDAPDTTLTSTSTSTHYVTSIVERVSPGSEMTNKRSSFSGIASGGWNITSTITAGASPAILSSLESESMTITSVYFTPVSSGESTTTTTIHTTTTIALRFTTTVLPASSILGRMNSTTTAALPAAFSPSGSALTDPIAQSLATTVHSGKFSLSPDITLAKTTTGTMIGITTSSSSVSLRPKYSPPSKFSAAGISTAGLPSSFPQSWTWSMPPNHTDSTRMPLGTPGTTSNSMIPQSSFQAVSKADSPTVTLASGVGGISQPSSKTPSASELATLQSQPSGSRGISMVWSNFSAPYVRPTASPEALNTGSASSIPATFASSPDQSDHVTGTTLGNTATLQTSSSFGTTELTTAWSDAMTTGNPSRTTYSLSETLASSMRGLNTSRASTTLANGPPSPHHASLGSSANGAYNSTSATNTLRSASSSEVQAHTSNVATASSRDSVSVSTAQVESATRATVPAIGQSTVTVLVSHSTEASLQSIKSSTHTTMAMHTIPKARMNATSANPFPASSATAAPATGCGEHGDFVVDFDDLPNFFPTENDTAITQAPPVLNPYHHLTFDDGYVYAPAPAEPYPPVSSPHLAVFLGNASGVTSRRRSENQLKSGEIGDGPRESISAFWFDAHSAWFGCDNPGPDYCTLVFKAFSWSAATKKEELTFQQNATIPPCPHRFNGCRLRKVDFPTSFRGLTGIQIQAFVHKEERMFFMDDLALRWSNNTCAAGLLRQSSR